MKTNNKTLALKVSLFCFILFINGCAGSESSDGSSGTDTGGTKTGTTGNHSKFAQAGDSLYVISGRNMHLYDVSTANNPKLDARIHLRREVSSLLTYEDKLIITSPIGIYLFDNSVPNNPVFQSKINNIAGCSGVQIKDNYLYESIGETACDGNDYASTLPSSQKNILITLDITSLTDPVQVDSFNMFDPKSIALDRNLLFACDGTAGLKLFDISNPQLMVKESFSDEIECSDLIAQKIDNTTGRLTAVTKTHIIQYQYDLTTNVVIKSNQMQIKSTPSL